MTALLHGRWQAACLRALAHRPLITVDDVLELEGVPSAPVARHSVLRAVHSLEERHVLRVARVRTGRPTTIMVAWLAFDSFTESAKNFADGVPALCYPDSMDKFCEELAATGTLEEALHVAPIVVARLLDVAPETAEGWCRSGALPARKIGRQWRVTVAGLRAFLEAHPEHAARRATGTS